MPARFKYDYKYPINFLADAYSSKEMSELPEDEITKMMDEISAIIDQEHPQGLAFIHHYYRDNLSFAETAELMGVSTIRIAQIRRAVRHSAERYIIKTHYSNKPDDIYHLHLSARSSNALYRRDITTVQTLLALDYDKLSKIRNLGSKSIDEIVAKLEAKGYDCSHMKCPENDPRNNNRRVSRHTYTCPHCGQTFTLDK